MPTMQQRRFASRRFLFSSALLASVVLVPSWSLGAPLVPMTRLKLTVVQFVASSGEYRRWDALGGEFDVAPDGTITVPTLGSIPVGQSTADQLSGQIADRLQQKLGLLERPDASVQVLSYPPIYVVGAVSAPGQFEFRPGLSVVQALALAGGERMADGVAATTTAAIELEANLAGFNSDILRLQARLARLNAEFNHLGDIAFPDTLDASDPLIGEILEQERRIFLAHGNELARQKTGLVDLAGLFNAEIDALGQKMLAVEDQTTRAEQQVAAIKELVSSGSATTSRLSDAERILADLRSQRLDIIIATMTARENLNRSQRDLAKIEDEQQSETAGLLQQDQASLEKLLQQQSAARRMLVKPTEIDQGIVLAQQVETALSYAIVRQENGAMVTIAATEMTPLQPGDLVKVETVEVAPGSEVSGTDLASSQ